MSYELTSYELTPYALMSYVLTSFELTSYKPKPDDFIEALLDSRVVDALAKALSPFLNLSIDEALGKKLDGLTSAVRELKNENVRLSKMCDSLTSDNAKMNDIITV